MTTFSANLGFLWNDRPLADAIYAAKGAGFDAVECHWPFSEPMGDVTAALKDTGLPMLGLNTRRGDVQSGEFGLAALPGREAEARAAIDEAIDYAKGVGARSVHVMAGRAEGSAARQTFIDNLAFASERATAADLVILIEPLNPHDVPGYFLSQIAPGRALLQDLAMPNIKVMFDCYHVARAEGDVMTRLRDAIDDVGHIQFAGVPDRGRPDRGELNYRFIFEQIAALGWSHPLGAEYRPDGPTEQSLDWMSSLRPSPT